MVHYSTGDWDYSNTEWQLSSTVYVSPPSSFQELGTTNVLVKTSTVPIDKVKVGRLVSYFRMDRYGNYVHCLLRWQDGNNNYRVRFRQTGAELVTVYIEKIKGGVLTELWHDDYAWATVVWRKIRVTWWNDYVGLVIRVEYWDGENWVIIHDAYDSENLWKDTGGRVGFDAHSYSAGLASYVDDTEIWGLW